VREKAAGVQGDRGLEGRDRAAQVDCPHQRYSEHQLYIVGIGSELGRLPQYSHRLVDTVELDCLDSAREQCICVADDRRGPLARHLEFLRVALHVHHTLQRL
jgi:hypothetical protein